MLTLNPMAPHDTSLLLFALVFLLLLTAVSAFSAPRDYGGWFTQERIANLRANCESTRCLVA